MDRNLDLAAATGASSLLPLEPLPEGRPEGLLSPGDFVFSESRWRAGARRSEHAFRILRRVRTRMLLKKKLWYSAGIKCSARNVAVEHTSVRTRFGIARTHLRHAPGSNT